MERRRKEKVRVWGDARRKKGRNSVKRRNKRKVRHLGLVQYISQNCAKFSQIEGNTEGRRADKSRMVGGKKGDTTAAFRKRK